MIRVDLIQINYELLFETPFHFGTGLREGLVHRTVNRDTNGYLYVPGSTLKGVLRERCEQLAALFHLKALEPHTDQSALAEFNPDADIIYRIFGSRFQPGTLYFDDAYMTSKSRELFDGSSPGDKKYLDRQVQSRTQVSLSRLTRTAKQGALYTSESGLRQLRFEGKVYGLLRGYEFVGDQVGTYGLLLLLMGLSSLDRLGGNKSSGMGLVSCQIHKLTVNDETQNMGDWLADIVGLELYKDE